MKTLVVVAYHNGSQYLDGLLEYLPSYPFLFVDTGSTDAERQRLHCFPFASNPGGYCVGAYEYAFRVHPQYDAYLFLHDSMRIKVRDFVSPFTDAPVKAWIEFKMDYGPSELPYLQSYNLSNPPSHGIFGPIFYAERKVLEQITWPWVKSRAHLVASERSLAFAFWQQAGLQVRGLEPYDNDRIDTRRDYALFDKYRPNRA